MATMFAGVKLETPDYQYSSYSYSSTVNVKCEWLPMIGRHEEDRRPSNNKRTRIVYDSDSDCSVSDYLDYEYEQPLRKSLKLEHLDEEEEEENLAIAQSETDFTQLIWREDMDNLSNMMRNIMEPTEVYPVKVEPKESNDHDDVVDVIRTSELFFDDDLPDLDDEDVEDDDDDHSSVGRGISDASDDGMEDDDTEVTARMRPLTPVDADADCFQDSNDSIDLPCPGPQPSSPEPDLIIMSPEPPKPVELVDLDDEYDTVQNPTVVTPEPQKPHHLLTPPPTPKLEETKPRWMSLPFMRLKKEPTPIKAVTTAPSEVIDLCDSSDEESEKPPVPLRVTLPEIPVEDEIVICSSDDEDDGDTRTLQPPDCLLPPSPESGDNHEETCHAQAVPVAETSPCPSPEETQLEEERTEVELEEKGPPTLPKLVTVLNPWLWTRRNLRRCTVTDFSATETQLMNSAFENDKSLRLACATARTLTTQSHRPMKKVKLKFLNLLSESMDKDMTDRCYSVLRHIIRHHTFCSNRDVWPKLNNSVQRVKTELRCKGQSESLRANVLCIAIITQSVEKNLQCRLSDVNRLQKSSALMSEFFSSKLETLVDWLRWCIVEKWTGYQCEKMETIKCFQLLITLPLLVCNDPISHAENLARSFGLVYVSLLSLEERTVMLSTIPSPLLLVKLLTNVLDCSESSMNTLHKPLKDRYSSHIHLSLDKIVHYYFLMPPLHRPPTCAESNGRSRAVAVEELAMILNMLLRGYFLCKEEKYIKCVDDDNDDDRSCLRMLNYHLRALKDRLLARSGGARLSERTMFLLNSMGQWTDS